MRLLWFSNAVWRGIGLATAVALRVVALGRADLSTDEIQTLHAVRLPFREMLDERLAAGHAPLYFVAEKAWCAAFGTSQFALRFPSVLFGLLLLWPAWSLFRRVAGDKAAWWGAAILGLHPLMVELSREARMYPLLLLAVLVAADAAAASLDGERPGALFWAAAALGPLVHPTWGIAVLPLAAWLAVERRRASPETRRASAFALAGLLASALLLAAVLVVAVPQHQEMTRRAWLREAAVFILRIFAGSDLRPFHGFLALVAVVGIWGIRVLHGLGHAPARARRLALLWALGVPLLSVVVGLVGGVPWGPARYVQAAAVGFTLLASISAGADPSPRKSGVGPILALLCTVASTFPLVDARVAWSRAASELSGEPSPVVVDDESSRIVLAHYLGRDVHVGAPPAGATAWRRVSIDPASGGARVRIATEPPPEDGPR